MELVKEFEKTETQVSKYKKYFSNDEIHALEECLESSLALFLPDNKHLPKWIMNAEDLLEDTYYDTNFELMKEMVKEPVDLVAKYAEYLTMRRDEEKCLRKSAQIRLVM